MKRRLVDTASRQIRTFIHQVDSSQSSELESVLDETEMNTTDHATPDSNENELEDAPCEDASCEDASSVSKSESDEDSSKESETEEAEEDQFVFSQDPLSCNTNVTAQNASMGLYGIAARHCWPDKALFDLLTWHKIVHLQDILPAPNYIKNETNKLTEQYIAVTETNGTGEVIVLSFADKLQENFEKYITEILDYANLDTKTDLKLTAVFHGNALNVKFILNTDRVMVQESSDCSAYPVWVALADLPPKLRFSFDNIHLCSLWYGKGSIDWDSIFEHYLSEVSKDRKIKANGVDYQLKHQTVFVILELVCNHDVLQMKKFNGYYGCGVLRILCTMRGVQKFPGGQSYANNQPSTMRDPGMHEYLVRQFESGSVEERKGRNEKEPEIDILGVKGRSNLFKVIPNLPLTCPVDRMHQCLKGVANDIINFFAEQLSYDEVQKFDGATKQVILPSEFKRSVSSLRSREHFKANELKSFLLYFAPIVFQSFPENSLAHESNLQNLNYLIFALRSMYETVDEAKLCGYLLETFCYNMSILYPLKKFNSIYFHLLRHLAWQCKFVGPLWTTSATMFESANNHLIKTLTGTVNTCSLIVKRYIRNRQFDSMEVKNDNLTGFFEALRGKPSGFKDDFSMKRNNVFSNFPRLGCFAYTEENSTWTADCIQDLKQTVLFHFLRRTKFLVGQILLFIEKESVILCAVQLYNILDKLALDLSSTEFHGQDNKLKPLGYRVKLTEVQVYKCCSINNKLILFPFLNNLYFFNVLTHFEHD